MLAKDPNPFKNRSRAEMHKFFKETVPEGFTDAIYDLFFFASVGVLSEFGTDQFVPLMEKFNDFLAAAEDITNERKSKDEETVKEEPYLKPENWLSR